MKVCFISTEIFAWGKYGGFGRATRLIASELAKKGIEVSAVVPIRENQNKFELLDGIKIYGYPIYNPLKSISILKEIDADIYHSEEPSLGTYFAQIAKSKKAHVVTFRDTRLFYDWLIEFKNPSLNKFQVLSNFFFENNILVARAVRNATAVYSTADFISEKATQKYKLNEITGLLRSPVKVKDEVKKSETPRALYLGRLDKRKRPEKFLELAKDFPSVEFFVVGKSRDENYQNYLLNKYQKYSNIKFCGFVDQFSSDEFSKILGSSWVLVNTALREGLPNAFVEALAHKCAIISSVDPDNITSRFGIKVENDNFAGALQKILLNDDWKTKGVNGYKFINENFSIEKIIYEHIKAYNSILKIPYSEN